MPTYILIAANVAVYVATSFIGGDAIVTSDSVLYHFGQYNPKVFQGEIWRLFTAMFIHADIAHIAGNMLFLLIFGLRAEEMFDIKEYMSIYLLSGLAGGFLSLLLGPLLFGPDLLSVGASGAIFGVLGATIIYARRAIGQSIVTALLYAFFLFAINTGPSVNYLAHLGGLVIGLLMGYTLASGRRLKPQITYQYGYSYGSDMLETCA
jgi:rhomboid protease GluP